MFDVTVKTLDGKNRSFSVPDDITVKQFKEKIASSIEIPEESQRLIFQGRVLQDDKALNSYASLFLSPKLNCIGHPITNLFPAHLASSNHDQDHLITVYRYVNGKTVHVVQRAPPSARPPPSSTAETTPTSQHGDRPGEIRTFVGSFTLPSDVVDPNQVQNIVQNVLSGMGDVGRNAQISTSSSNDGSSVDVHINLGQIGGAAQIQSESQNRIRVAQRMISRARVILDRLENPVSGDGEDIEVMDVTPNDASPGETPRESTPDTQTPGTSDTQTPGTSAAATSTPDETAGSTSPSAEGGTPPSGTADSATQTDRSQNPNTGVLAELLSDVFEVNRRLQPYLERYQQFMRDDPNFENETESARAAQHLCNGVSGVMHYVSHAYHSISDLMVDTRQLPPRVIRSHPVAHPAAIIQQTIPVQAQINVAHISPRGSPSLARRANGNSSTTTSSTTTSTTTSSQQSTPNPPQPNIRMGMPFRFGMPPGMPDMAGGMPAGISVGMPPGMPAGMAAGMPPGGFGPGGQPMMFMELGPQGIHINSISAQVVTSSSSSSSSSSSTSSTTSTAPNVTVTSGSTPAPGPRTTPAGPQRPPTAFQLPTGGFQIPPGAFGAPGGPQPGGVPQFMPPAFLQNIIQMATGQAMGGQGMPGQAGNHQVFVLPQGNQMPNTQTIPSTAGGRTSTASSTSQPNTTPAQGTTQPRATQPGTTTTTQSAAMPGAAMPGLQGPRPRAAFVIPRPGFLPSSLPGLMPSVDPYLPCQSRFFLRRRLGAAMTPGGANGQPGDGQADQALAGMVSSIVSSIINQNPNLAGTVGTPRVPTAPAAGAPVTTSTGQPIPNPSPANPFASLFTPPVVPSTTAPVPAAGQPPSNQEPLADQLRNLLQMARPPTSGAQSQSTTSSTSQSASTTGSQSGSRPSPMGDEMFAQLVSGIGNYVSQAAMGQQASDSIYDFVNALGQDYGGSNEGLLTDIFVCVSQHLTIVDLMAIFCHQTASLQRLIQPLQQFVRERILQGREASEEIIDTSVENLVEEMLPQVEEICTDAAVCNNIDFPASVQELLRFHLKQNTQLILNAQENDAGFGDRLYDNIQALIQEFLVLSGCCLEGGTQAVNTMVQNNVRRISADINPMLQQWMTNMTTQQIQTIQSNMRVTAEQVEMYIVRRADMDTSQQSSDGSFQSAESGDKEEKVAVNGATAMEVPGCDCNGAVENDGMDTDEENTPSPRRSRDRAIPEIPAALLQHVPDPPQELDEIPVIVGSESWHSQVPSDWVQVIARDGHRQQHLPTQQPFSDAYINGMPPKRRKLMSRSEDATELADIRTMLPQAIGRAAEAAGAQPITSLADMEKDAAGSTTLREAFQQEMEDSIRKRMHNDSDYIPEKYPNSEKYFKGNKK